MWPMPQTITFGSGRARRVQLTQGGRHALIGMVLLLNGLGAIEEATHATWADYLGVVAGALLLVAFVRELRGAIRGGQHHEGHGIGWVDVCAGLVTFVEAAHFHHQGKHLLPWAYVLVGLMLVGVGLAHPALSATRRLVLDEEGFDIRLKPWRRVRRAWSDVRSVSSSGARIDVVGVDGSMQVLDLRDAPESATVVAAFTAAAGRALAARGPM
jgi:hypothetical protein